MSSKPFELAVHDVGVLKDNRTVRLAPMTATAALQLGQACATMDPWRRYGIAADRLTAGFASTDDTAARYQVQIDNGVAGVMIIAHPWLLGPYLQFIAVLPAYQHRGVGRTLLAWFERQARQSSQRNMWLCVTGFNDKARAVYRADGWEQVALIPDLVATGVDEVLMRKRLF